MKVAFSTPASSGEYTRKEAANEPGRFFIDADGDIFLVAFDFQMDTARLVRMSLVAPGGQQKPLADFSPIIGGIAAEPLRMLSPSFTMTIGQE